MVALLAGQLVAGGRAHQVVGVAGQRPLRVEPGGVGKRLARGGAARSRPRRSGRRCGPGRRVGHRRRCRGRRCLARRARASRIRPSRVPRSDRRGARRVVADEFEAVSQRCGVSQVEAGQCQAGGGEVDVTVDECGCHKAAVEVDHLRIRKLLAPNVIAAEPRDDAVAYRHRGRVGHGGAVHPPVEEEGRHLLGLALHGRGSTAGSSLTSMTSPSM